MPNMRYNAKEASQSEAKSNHWLLSKADRKWSHLGKYQTFGNFGQMKKSFFSRGVYLLRQNPQNEMGSVKRFYLRRVASTIFIFFQCSSRPKSRNAGIRSEVLTSTDRLFWRRGGITFNLGNDKENKTSVLITLHQFIFMPRAAFKTKVIKWRKNNWSVQFSWEN